MTRIAAAHNDDYFELFNAGSSMLTENGTAILLQCVSDGRFSWRQSLATVEEPAFI